MPEPLKALILLASRPETVQVVVEGLRPEVLGVIVSQEIPAASSEAEYARLRGM
jgi:hypothetical protein